MNRQPLRPVSREDVARFKEDGAICIREVFDQEWVARMNAAVDRLLAAPSSDDRFPLRDRAILCAMYAI